MRAPGNQRTRVARVTWQDSSLARAQARHTASGLALALVAFVLLGGCNPPVSPQSQGPTETLRNPVRAAVRGSQAGHLRVSPDKARYDRAAVFKDGCQLTAPETVQKECLYGDRTAAKSAVLLGDSHAAHWFPAIDMLAAARGYRLYSWTKSACPWYDLAITQHKTEREYTECATWRTDVMRRLESQQPDVLFVASIAGIYKARAGGSTLAREQSQPLIEDAIVRTLAQLRRRAHRVVFITDNPRREDNIPLCIKANIRKPSACDIPRRIFRTTSSTDATTAHRAPGVVVADLTDRFCNATTCPAVLDGYIVYGDRNHLTASFARSAASWFTDFLP
ncbi:MAG: hypothetical protein EB027_01705 [Actinobacteria bacterium]|nr:hypothetical protein [Actinomycetota bacterium]